MTAVAGLYEVTKEAYLQNRINQVRSFVDKLQANGLPVLSPPGGHAVYLNMDKKSPEEQKSIPNLIPFAVPLHVLSDEHINYTVAAIKDLHNRRHLIPNVEITRGKEMRLRQFSSGLKLTPVNHSNCRACLNLVYDIAEE